MTIISMEKNYILLTPYNTRIYQKQRTESVYLISKNNYGLFSETLSHMLKLYHGHPNRVNDIIGKKNRFTKTKKNMYMQF